MNEGPVMDGRADREALQRVHEDLDSLEAHLSVLAVPSNSAMIDLVLRLRRAVIEEFPTVTRPRGRGACGAETDNDRPGPCARET
jgi:hypothetical protein